jgi:hypothetical protein
MLGVLKLCFMHIFCMPTSMSMNHVHAEHTLVAVHKYWLWKFMVPKQARHASSVKGIWDTEGGWIFRCSGMLCSVAEWVVPDILNEEGQSAQEKCICLGIWILSMKALCYIEMLGTTCPATQDHVPADLILGQHCCENLNSYRKGLLTHCHRSHWQNMALPR